MEPWADVAKMKQSMWETILLWSGYDYYRSIKEIATELGVRQETVRSRIRRFSKRFPQSFEKIKADRAAIKAATMRIDKSLESPVSFKSEMEGCIREVF